MATSGGLEGFLNTAIPLLLLVVAVSFCYYKFKEPIMAFLGWIKDLFGIGMHKVKQIPHAGAREIIYGDGF